MTEPRTYVFYDHRDSEKRIRVLQEMLRTVSRLSGDPEISSRVDGRFDPGTENALRAFQRTYGLAETGTADLVTWEKLRAVYRQFQQEYGAPAAIRPFRDASVRLSHGDGGGIVTILQVMLDEIRTRYDGLGEIPATGVYDKATEAAVRAFQRANLLNETGILDAASWNRLADEYDFALRDRQ